MPDRENEGKKAEKTDHPRQERPHARHFAKETRRDLDKPRFDEWRDLTAGLMGRRDHLIQSESANEPRLHEMRQHGVAQKDH